MIGNEPYPQFERFFKYMKIFKKDKYVVMTLRLEREIQEEFDKLAAKSDYSRNELMCRALKYALDNLEFVQDTEE